MQNTHHVCINFAFKCYLTKGRVKEKKVMEFSITLEGTPLLSKVMEYIIFIYFIYGF